MQLRTRPKAEGSLVGPVTLCSHRSPGLHIDQWNLGVGFTLAASARGSKEPPAAGAPRTHSAQAPAGSISMAKFLASQQLT